MNMQWQLSKNRATGGCSKPVEEENPVSPELIARRLHGLPIPKMMSDASLLSRFGFGAFHQYFQPVSMPWIAPWNVPGFPQLFDVPWMCLGSATISCSSDVFLRCLLVACSFDVPWLCPWLLIGCVLAVHWMCLGCLLEVPWMLGLSESRNSNCRENDPWPEKTGSSMGRENPAGSIYLRLGSPYRWIPSDWLGFGPS